VRGAPASLARKPAPAARPRVLEWKRPERLQLSVDPVRTPGPTRVRMVQLDNLTKAFGERVLLERVTWQIGGRDRVGLCGPNGAGKTTLLRMLAGLEPPDEGRIVRPNALEIGYLPQDGLAHAGRSLFEEALTAFEPLLALKAELHAIEARLADGDVSPEEHQRLLDRYSDRQEEFRRRDGYRIDLQVATVLRGLGFSPADFEQPTESFSGGWQMRIALAKLLLRRPGLLLLDEPTNHLDLEARNWLEDFLTAYPGAVVVVSHDRYFLDAVVTRITEIGLKTLVDYPGTYSAYVREREARLERLREAKRRQDEEIARIRQFVDRFRYQATKAAQVQSRLKLLEKIVPIEVPPERKRVHFAFPPCARSGRLVFELRNVRKAYGDLVVFRDVTLHIERGDRVALVGPNGAGKSTLMRLLAGVEAPDRGDRREGHHVLVQYFAQDEAARLDPALTVYETLAAGSPDHMVPAIRTILGGFLFSGDDVYKRVAVLSGGERTRLAVARMLLRPANTLLLDEPTNHLDLDSKDVLLEALEDFGGTLVFVSHDRYFVERLATKIVEVGGGEAVLYPGTYEEFRWRKSQGAGAASPETGESQRPSAVARPAPGREAPAAASGRGDRRRSRQPAARDEETRRRREAERRRRRLAELEARIAERERAIKELEASMAAPGFFADHAAARPILDRHQALMWEVGDLMNQWEALQALDAEGTSRDGT
jgi:ATP-binding cassette subfamily F protein 3